MKRSTSVLVGVVGLVAAGGVTAGVVALSGVAEDEVVERGTCAGTVHELTVDPEDDRPGLEVSFDLQSSGPGEAWEVSMRQGDTLLLDGQRTTDEDGELELDVPAAERDGTTFTVDFVSADGQSCTASLTL